MAQVDMQALKDLRAATNAPLKDCKQALEESGNDFAAAQEWLKQKGIMKAASKADRLTKEGVVVVKQIGDKTIGLKLACETDFVARNETFRGLAHQIVDLLANSEEVASREQVDVNLKQQIEDLLKSNFVAIGENMQVVDAFVKQGTSFIYTHPGDKLVATVFYTGDEQKAKEVAMQVAAMHPQYVSVDEVPADVREELTVRYTEEVVASGKPAEIAEKIVAGKLAKERQDIVLLEQSSIIDDSQKIKDRLGSTKVDAFIRYSIG